jgi:simple sugar transport system permease protein
MSPTDGVGLELEAIAATVIGGTSLMGGRGTVLGTALGALLMGVLSTGLVLAGAPTYWFRSFIGLIIVIAVVFNTRFNTARFGRSHG